MQAAKIANHIIAILFIALWVYAAFHKLIDLPTFKVQMGKSPMLSNIAPILAWAVPLFELVIAYLLLYRRTRQFGLYATIYLMVAFSTYLYITLNYSYYVPCTCGGFISAMDWRTHIFFNLGCAAVAAVAIVLAHRQQPQKVTG